MSSHPDGNPGGSQGSPRSNPSGAQGASRGGVQPDDSAEESERRSSYDPDAAYDRGSRRAGGSGGGDGAPFGGYPFGGSQSGRSSGGWRSYLGGDAKFLGLPVTLIYAMGAAIIGLVFIGAVCARPTATGSVAGQVKQLSADRSITTLAGADLTLRGGGQTYTTTSTDVDPTAEGEAAYNYRFENVPPGTYALAVTPPAGATLQPEDGITLKVESGQLFPQSVMLLAQGVQKPRQLAQNELQPGEAGGYVNDKGERVTHQQGSGFDSSDALLMYLLWRNPPGWGYGAPPVIVGSPGGPTGSNYRVADPPSQTRSGQTVTQQKPSTPGQGSTRPSSGSGATGSAPSRTSGDAVAPSTGTGSSGASSSSGSGASTSTQTKPSTSVGAPSQGSTRPSSSSSSPSRSSAPSRSSGGGRR